MMMMMIIVYFARYSMPLKSTLHTVSRLLTSVYATDHTNKLLLPSSVVVARKTALG